MLHDGGLVAQGVPDQVLQPDLIESVFKVKTQVIRHPVHGCPLVVS
jgi:iron complex transport system ATP-binding protein